MLHITLLLDARAVTALVDAALNNTENCRCDRALLHLPNDRDRLISETEFCCAAQLEQKV